MEAITLEVAANQYKTAKEARRDGKIPMVYYAKGIEPRHFTVEYQTFRKAYKKAGKSTIITLIDEQKESLPVLVQDIQYHPVTDTIDHVDLKAIRKDQKLSTKVPLVFVGEAPAVREFGGTVIHNKDTISIECLPKDLPHEIQVDVSSLIDFHASLTVSDLKVPAGVTVMDDSTLTIAMVSAPRKEEELTGPPVASTTEVPGEKKEENSAATAPKAASKGK